MGDEYADAQDLQFGKAAADKEDAADAAAEQGEPLPSDDTEEAPRAGNKAEPAD